MTHEELFIKISQQANTLSSPTLRQCYVYVERCEWTHWWSSNVYCSHLDSLTLWLIMLQYGWTPILVLHMWPCRWPSDKVLKEEQHDLVLDHATDSSLLFPLLLRFPFVPLYFFHIDSFLLTLCFVILLVPYSLYFTLTHSCLLFASSSCFFLTHLVSHWLIVTDCYGTGP